MHEPSPAHKAGTPSVVPPLHDILTTNALGINRESSQSAGSFGYHLGAALGALGKQLLNETDSAIHPQRSNSHSENRHRLSLQGETDEYRKNSVATNDVSNLVDKNFHHAWVQFCRRQTIARAYEVEYDLTGAALLAASCNASKRPLSFELFPSEPQLRRTRQPPSPPSMAQSLNFSQLTPKTPTHFAGIYIDHFLD